MEFRIQKTEFLRGLRLAQGIADRKSTMPILANVLLRTEAKNKLVLAATDLNVSVSAELAAVDPPLLAALAAHDERRIRAVLTLVSGHVYVDVAGSTCDGPLHAGSY